MARVRGVLKIYPASNSWKAGGRLSLRTQATKKSRAALSAQIGGRAGILKWALALGEGMGSVRTCCIRRPIPARPWPDSPEKLLLPWLIALIEWVSDSGMVIQKPGKPWKRRVNEFQSSFGNHFHDCHLFELFCFREPRILSTFPFHNPRFPTPLNLARKRRNQPWPSDQAAWPRSCVIWPFACYAQRQHSSQGS